jgi:hypothetical protein
MSKSNIEAIDALIKLQEIGLQVNEYKKNGGVHIPIEDYEKLLNWSIEAIRIATDQHDVLVNSIDALLDKVNSKN